MGCGGSGEGGGGEGGPVVSLLEVNSYPDFKQTGAQLEGVIGELMDETVRVAIAPFFRRCNSDPAVPGGKDRDGQPDGGEGGAEGKMVKVLDIDLGL